MVPAFWRQHRFWSLLGLPLVLQALLSIRFAAACHCIAAYSYGHYYIPEAQAAPNPEFGILSGRHIGTPGSVAGHEGGTPGCCITGRGSSHPSFSGGRFHHRHDPRPDGLRQVRPNLHQGRQVRVQRGGFGAGLAKGMASARG